MKTAILGLLLVLAGCGSTPSQPSLSNEKAAAGWVNAGWVSLPGGGRVICAYTGSGGVDCDWSTKQ